MKSLLFQIKVVSGMNTVVNQQVLSAHLHMSTSELQQATAQNVSNQLQRTAQNHDYQELLDRILSSKQANEAVQLRYGGMLTALLRQPVEIVTDVFSHLTFSDLMNLRLVNKRTHELVHYSAETIGANLAESINVSFDIQHIPVAIPNLESLLMISRRFQLFDATAGAIAERIGMHLQRDTISKTQDESALTAWRNKKIKLITHRLTRSFIILQQYLDLMRDTFVDNEPYFQPLNDEEYETLTNIFDFDQQAFMTKRLSELTENDYNDVTAAFNILKAACKARSFGFSTCPNGSPWLSVKALMLYTGFFIFPAILAKEFSQTVCDQVVGQAASLVEKQRNASFRINPNVNITHLDGYLREVERNVYFDKRRNRRARATFVQNQNLWGRAARSLIMQKFGTVPRDVNATAWIRKICTGTGTCKESDIKLGPWDSPF